MTTSLLVLLSLVVLALITPIVIYTARAQSEEARNDVKHWATTYNMELLCVQKRLWPISSLHLFRTNRQHVFWIEVKTQTGENKKGWIRIGPNPTDVVLEWDWP